MERETSIESKTTETGISLPRAGDQLPDPRRGPINSTGADRDEAGLATGHPGTLRVQAPADRQAQDGMEGMNR